MRPTDRGYNPCPEQYFSSALVLRTTDRRDRATPYVLQRTPQRAGNWFPSERGKLLLPFVHLEHPGDGFHSPLSGYRQPLIEEMLKVWRMRVSLESRPVGVARIIRPSVDSWDYDDVRTEFLAACAAQRLNGYNGRGLVVLTAGEIRDLSDNEFLYPFDKKVVMVNAGLASSREIGATRVGRSFFYFERPEDPNIEIDSPGWRYARWADY